MIKKVLGLSAGLILSLAGIASATGDQPTKFTVRIENTTKPDAFTASNGVKWSLAYSPGTAVVHPDNAPVFSAGKKDRAAILAAVAQTRDFDGLLGKWSIDANGDTSIKIMSGNTVKNGEFSFVKILGQ